MASAMITEFGGAVAVPSAVRKSDSTTTMRVNDVIMIRIEGATDRMVNSAISWIARSVTPPPPWPKLMLISCASAGSRSEEHTSELQSRPHLVCRLLLEKKKKKIIKYLTSKKKKKKKT